MPYPAEDDAGMIRERCRGHPSKSVNNQMRHSIFVPIE
jgi:hypothetical protein